MVPDLPGLLGSRAGFEAALNANRAETLERLRAQLAPFILRRTKNEVATELPPKVEMDLLCPMTDVQRAEYARICTEGLARLGDDVGTAMREKSFGFLALLTRLRQTCWCCANPSSPPACAACCAMAATPCLGSNRGGGR